MRNPGVALVIRIAIEQSESLPMAERALLYRGLADICGSEVAEDNFLRAAQNLEIASVHAREAEMNLFPDPSYSATPSADQTAKMAV